MKVSDKRILIILSAFLFIFIATSVLEAINRHQIEQRREREEQRREREEQWDIERLQMEKERRQMEKERHQLEKKLHQMRMEELRQQSKSPKR